MGGDCMLRRRAHGQQALLPCKGAHGLLGGGQRCSDDERLRCCNRGCGGASRRPALRSLGFASVSMSGSGGNGEPDDLCDDAPVRDLDASLAIGKRRKGVVLTDPAEIEELKQELAKLTPEQREELRALAAQRVLNSFKDEVGAVLPPPPWRQSG